MHQARVLAFPPSRWKLGMKQERYETFEADQRYWKAMAMRGRPRPWWALWQTLRRVWQRLRPKLIADLPRMILLGAGIGILIGTMIRILGW
jgi:hypothetical protein